MGGGRRLRARVGQRARRHPSAQKGDPHELILRPTVHPGRPRLRLRGAEPPRGVHRHVHQPVRKRRRTAPARGHRRRRAAAAAGARLAGELVRLAPADAGASRGLRGHRGRPARHRADRQTPGRVRHRHPGRGPGRADGRARPRAVRRGRPRHRVLHQLRAGRRSPGSGRPPGRRRGPWAPGVNPSPPLFGLPEPINNKLWHLAFNRVNDEMTEQLVRGREDIFFGYEFAIQGGQKGLPDEVQRYYFDLYSDPDVLRGSFGLYRALDTTLAQNAERKNRPLTMPVLAIGGAESWGEEAGNGIKPAADDVQSVVISSAGHWVAEQAPEEMLAALNEFLAPYRDVA